jgi:predicted metallopeptidase
MRNNNHYLSCLNNEEIKWLFFLNSYNNKFNICDNINISYSRIFLIEKEIKKKLQLNQYYSLKLISIKYKLWLIQKMKQLKNISCQH